MPAVQSCTCVTSAPQVYTATLLPAMFNLMGALPASWHTTPLLPSRAVLLKIFESAKNALDDIMVEFETPDFMIDESVATQ